MLKLLVNTTFFIKNSFCDDTTLTQFSLLETSEGDMQSDHVAVMRELLRSNYSTNVYSKIYSGSISSVSKRNPQRRQDIVDSALLETYHVRAAQ